MEKLLKKYLDENTLMQLVSINDNKQPWLCSVYFASDENHNIYWTSAKSRRHSQEIIHNPNTACTIVHDSQKKQSVTITGQAYQVAQEDLEHVYAIYSKKFGEKISRLNEAREDTPDGRAFWVLKPEHIYCWDEVNYPENPKQKFL